MQHLTHQSQESALSVHTHLLHLCFPAKTTVSLSFQTFPGWLICLYLQNAKLWLQGGIYEALYRKLTEPLILKRPPTPEGFLEDLKLSTITFYFPADEETGNAS